MNLWLREADYSRGDAKYNMNYIDIDLACKLVQGAGAEMFIKRYKDFISKAVRISSDAYVAAICKHNISWRPNFARVADLLALAKLSDIVAFAEDLGLIDIHWKSSYFTPILNCAMKSGDDSFVLPMFIADVTTFPLNLYCDVIETNVISVKLTTSLLGIYTDMADVLSKITDAALTGKERVALYYRYCSKASDSDILSMYKFKDTNKAVEAVVAGALTKLRTDAVKEAIYKGSELKKTRKVV